MIPDLFPFKTALVYLTGVLELLFAAGLLMPKTKVLTGWVLIAFLLAVLPANINAAMEISIFVPVHWTGRIRR